MLSKDTLKVHLGNSDASAILMNNILGEELRFSELGELSLLHD